MWLKNMSFKNFKEVDKATITRLAFIQFTMNLNFTMSFVGTFDRVRLCYKESAQIQVQSKCVNLIIDFDGKLDLDYIYSFPKDELLFATSYDFFIETIGCENKCIDVSSTPAIARTG
jgi:hypothetical protein